MQMNYDNPTEYHRHIMRRLAQNNVSVQSVDRKNVGGFSVYHDATSTIYHSRDPHRILQFNIFLAHELVHMMQDAHAPRMPVELMEYQAYLVTGTGDRQKLARLDIRDSLFYCINMSARFEYAVRNHSVPWD